MRWCLASSGRCPKIEIFASLGGFWEGAKFSKLGQATGAVRCGAVQRRGVQWSGVEVEWSGVEVEVVEVEVGLEMEVEV